jgi:hypothetical protein
MSDDKLVADLLTELYESQHYCYIKVTEIRKDLKDFQKLERLIVGIILLLCAATFSIITLL